MCSSIGVFEHSLWKNVDFSNKHPNEYRMAKKIRDNIIYCTQENRKAVSFHIGNYVHLPKKKNFATAEITLRLSRTESEHCQTT